MLNNFSFVLSIYFIVLRIKSLFWHIFSFVKIDYSFILLLFLALILESIHVYFLYVLFIILHELSHLFVARKLGYFPEKLKLTMFGASLEGFDDFLLKDEIKIIFAGPVFNLLVVIFCYLMFWFYPESFEVLQDVLMVNLSILGFNLLPIFPLDAGRLVLCFSSVKKGRIQGVKFVKNLSMFFVVILFSLSILSMFVVLNFALGFTAINLCVLLFESSKGTSFKREVVFRKKLQRLNKGIVQKVVYVPSFYSNQLLLKFIDGEHYFIFIFVDDCFVECKRIEEKELLKDLGFI